MCSAKRGGICGLRAQHRWGRLSVWSSERVEGLTPAGEWFYMFCSCVIQFASVHCLYSVTCPLIHSNNLPICNIHMHSLIHAHKWQRTRCGWFTTNMVAVSKCDFNTVLSVPVSRSRVGVLMRSFCRSFRSIDRFFTGCSIKKHHDLIMGMAREAFLVRKLTLCRLAQQSKCLVDIYCV